MARLYDRDSVAWQCQQCKRDWYSALSPGSKHLFLHAQRVLIVIVVVYTLAMSPDVFVDIAFGNTRCGRREADRKNTCAIQQSVPAANFFTM